MLFPSCRPALTPPVAGALAADDHRHSSSDNPARHRNGVRTYVGRGPCSSLGKYGAHRISFLKRLNTRSIAAGKT